MPVLNMTGTGGGGGGPAKPEQEKSITITQNSTTDVLPDQGKTLSKVTVTVSVPAPPGLIPSALFGGITIIGVVTGGSIYSDANDRSCAFASAAPE